MKTILKDFLKKVKITIKEIWWNIKQWFFIGISFLWTVLIIGWWVYAYTWIAPSSVNTWDTLTATTWNNMVNDLNYLKDIADNSIWKKTWNDIYYSSWSVGIGTSSPIRALTINWWEMSIIKQAWNATSFINVSDSWWNGWGNLQIRGLASNGSAWINLSNISLLTNKLDVSGTIGSNYLEMNPQDSINEWWELQLKWAWLYWAFQFDNFQWNARIHTLWVWKNLEILGTAWSSWLKFPDGTVQTTAASWWNSWVNVSLSDTANFDLNCEYRAKVNKWSFPNPSSIQNSIYFSKVTTWQISLTLVETWWYATSAQPRYINKWQKGTFYWPDSSEWWQASSPIATLQKRCVSW
jgi:hypothetical protein